MQPASRTTPRLNPWLQVWIHPKKTLYARIHTKPKRHLIWLACVAGLLTAIMGLVQIWVEQPQRGDYKTMTFTLMTLLGGVFLGVLYLYFGAWLLRLVGWWLGGEGSYTEVRCALGWTYYPFIIASIFALATYFSHAQSWQQLLFGTLHIISLTWACVLGILLLAAAHHFTPWRSLLTFVIGGVLLTSAMTLVGLLIPMLAPLFT